MISFKRMHVEVAAAREMIRGNLEIDRPQVRSDCEICPVCQAARDSGRPLSPLPCGHAGDEILWHSRPCVLVGCRHALYLDVTDLGSIKLTRPELEPEEMPAAQSCVLDVAKEAGLTLDGVGVILDVSRERVRQLEVEAIDNFRLNGTALGLNTEALGGFPNREQGAEYAGNGDGDDGAD